MPYDKYILKKLSFLSTFSFWIYAAHAPFITAVIKKLIPRFLPMKNGFILFAFFATGVLSIAVLMISGLLLKKILSNLFAFITGGRK